MGLLKYARFLAVIGMIGIAAPAYSQTAPDGAATAVPRPAPILGWFPKRNKLAPWPGPGKPIWRVTDIIKRHEGQKDWVQPLIDDGQISAKYVQMGPGEKTKTMMYLYTRVMWVVQSGQIRFSVAGQEPFVASKGFVVDVPHGIAFSMETVGDEPSLRFELMHAGMLPSYPLSESPPNVPGVTYVKGQFGVTVPAAYDENNRLYIDFNKQVIEDGGHPTPLFKDDGLSAGGALRSPGIPMPPDTEKGHWHPDAAEAWFIMEGTVNYKIEGLPKPIVAHEGDVVYAPAGRWHRPTSGGATGAMASRMTINIAPYIRNVTDLNPGQ